MGLGEVRKRERLADHLRGGRRDVGLGPPGAEFGEEPGVDRVPADRLGPDAQQLGEVLGAEAVQVRLPQPPAQVVLGYALGEVFLLGGPTTPGESHEGVAEAHEAQKDHVAEDDLHSWHPGVAVDPDAAGEVFA